MSQAVPAHSERRSQSLDILRAVAVILVMWNHLPICPAEISPLFHRVSFFLHKGGWIGVDLFFVLSGFLVSSLLFKEERLTGKIGVLHFYIRRGLRIYPAFYGMLLIKLAAMMAGSGPFAWKPALAELFFYQNYVEGLYPHTWSLAVEEHFYLLLPLLMVLLMKRSAGRGPAFAALPAVIGAAAVLILGLRLNMTSYYPLDIYRNYYPTHLRIDSLFFGVLIAYYYQKDRGAVLGFARRFRLLLLALGIPGLLPAFYFAQLRNSWIPSFGYTLFYLSAGAILISSLAWPEWRSKFARGAAYLGSHSYSIYLWHITTLFWGVPLARRVLERFIGWNWFLEAAIYFAGAAAVGIVYALILEKPILRLRDRLFPSRSAAPGSAPAGGPAAPTAAEQCEPAAAPVG